MAMADYYLCDGCGRKCFYDSNLNYEWSAPKHEPTRKPVRGTSMWLDSCGDMGALCAECAKTHKVAIVPLTEEEIRDAH